MTMTMTMTKVTLIVLSFITLGAMNGVNFFELYPTTSNIIITLVILGNCVTLYKKIK